MYLKEYIKKFDNKKIKIFVDMDGTIVDYVVGNSTDFADRRPLTSSIEKLEEISKQNNVELYILSVTRGDKGLVEKQEWLDKYAPFFKQENRIVISRESNNMMLAYELKCNYLTNVERDGSVLVIIDDDPIVLREIGNTNKDVIRLKDTALVD